MYGEILSLGAVLIRTLLGAGSVLDIMIYEESSLKIMSFNITSVASGYQEIHPNSAMSIDSVKINTSLIMMKEWIIVWYSIVLYIVLY